MRRMLFFIFLLLFLTVTTVAAAKDLNRSEKITAIFQDFKIVFNGRLVATPVEPFQLESGHLMVPLRAVAEAFGYQVEWDPMTKAVYIGSESYSGEKIIFNPIYIEELPVLRNVGPFFNLQSRQITIAGRQFKRGLIVELAKEKALDTNKISGNIAETVIDLKGQYQWLEGYLGVDDETRNSIGNYILTILGDGLPLYETLPIGPSEYPFKFSLNMQNVKRLTVQAKWVEGEVGDDEKLWVALADWVFY